MRRPLRILGTAVVGVAFAAILSAQDVREFDMISATDAVHRAELFVAKNGYTRAEADPDHFDPEMFDNLYPVKEVLRRRHDTLKPAAYGYMYGSATILVFFQYSDDQSRHPQYVRVVRMRPDGSHTGLVHQGFMFLLSSGDQPDRCEIPPRFAESGLLYPRPEGLTEPLQPARAASPLGEPEAARFGPSG
jgi:hypothetical protein